MYDNMIMLFRDAQYNGTKLVIIYLIAIYNIYIYIYNIGVDRYVFFRADTDTDYYRSSRPITDILNRYTCLV